MRLNKFITDAGYCSRREADRCIEQGRVTVNGREAGLGDTVSEGDIVEVDGERVGRSAKRPVYIMLNKPQGVTCTSDPHDKTNVIDFVSYGRERLFHVGRLDKDSEGLLLLTNDGDIVNKILRAGNNHPKEYVVTVDKPVTNEFVSRMSKGVNILGVTTKPCKVVRKNDTAFIIFLRQGLNRQIRRMCQALGYKVVNLKRTGIMNLSLGGLETSRWRYLTAEEVRGMHAMLAGSSGTEEASDEPKAKPLRKPQGSSYSDYRKRGNSGNKLLGKENKDRRLSGGMSPGKGKMSAAGPAQDNRPAPGPGKASPGKAGRKSAPKWSGSQPCSEKTAASGKNGSDKSPKIKSAPKKNSSRSDIRPVSGRSASKSRQPRRPGKR